MDIVRVKVGETSSLETLSNAWREIFFFNQKVVFICVGTPRLIGDSVAPLIGSYLENSVPDLPVFGTVDDPITAINLEDTVRGLKGLYSDHKIIAVDVCVSLPTKVGDIYIKEEKLKPGRALSKSLKAFGHYKFCVNVSPRTDGGGVKEIVKSLQEVSSEEVKKMVSLMAESITNGWRGRDEMVNNYPVQ